MKKMINEFKTFAIKGNVIDMAIGIIVGTAFNAIVSSLIADILTPLLTLLTGESVLSNLSIVVREATETQKAVMLNIGLFLQKILDFLIIAFVAFGVVKGMNNLKADAEDVTKTTVPTPKDIQLLSEIRDLLQEQKKD